MIPEPPPPERDRDILARFLVPGMLVVLIAAGGLGLLRAWGQHGVTTGFTGDAPPPVAPDDTPVTAPDRLPVMRATATPEIAELRADLEGIVPDWRDARWSILVVSLDQGDTLFARTPDRALVPASNMKLVTSAAALHHLGPDYRFRSWVVSAGRIVDGRLEGDLVLLGTGDPGFSDRLRESHETVFEEMADSLLARGIHSIAGDVVADGSYFTGPLLGPEWDSADLNEWFAAPVSGVSYNENIVTLQIAPGRLGDAPRVFESPAGAGLEYRNNARTVSGAPRPRLWLERLSPRESVRIEGEIPSSGSAIWRRLTVADPETFAARGLRDVLVRKGLRVEGEARASSDRFPRAHLQSPRASDGRTTVVLASVESPPLREYLTVVNHVSHNLYSEAVFKTLGRVVRGEGSFRAGAAVVSAYLIEEAGVDPESARVLDGSGLSAGNVMSADAFVRVLRTVAGTADWDDFVSTLPVAGRRDGLRRMYRTAAAGNLRAKTGTIEGVSSLSGVVRTPEGERLLFSILVNGVRSTNAAKRVEDAIGTRLASFRRAFESDAGTTPDGS